MNRKYSLKKNHDIEKLVRSKCSVGNKYFAIYYHLIKNNTQIAFSISKKYGKAFERNYGKRVTKEIIRNLLKQGVISKDMEYKMLFVIKPSSKELTFEEKEKQIKYVIKQFVSKIK